MHIGLHAADLGDGLATFEAAQQILVGTNILSPSLVRRGWKLWKAPPLTGADSTAVKLASLKASSIVNTDMPNAFLAAESSGDDLVVMSKIGERAELMFKALDALSHDLEALT